MPVPPEASGSLKKVGRTFLSGREFMFFNKLPGGHPGRQGDDRPGWQTLRHGLEKLLLILRGIQATQQKCG